MIACCKLHGVIPFDYFVYVLQRIFTQIASEGGKDGGGDAASPGAMPVQPGSPIPFMPGKPLGEP